MGQDDDDQQDDDFDPDDVDSEEEGDDACKSADGKCCKDTVSEVEYNGNLYCSKYPIAVASDESGLTKTYPDGSTNTVWWQNIDRGSCEYNSMKMCHYDASEDGPMNASNENLADTPEPAPEAVVISVPEEDMPEAVPISVPEETNPPETSTNGSTDTSTPEAVPISVDTSSANSIMSLASVVTLVLAGFVGMMI